MIVSRIRRLGPSGRAGRVCVTVGRRDSLRAIKYPSRRALRLGSATGPWARPDSLRPQTS